MNNPNQKLTYDAIQKEAEAFSASYRKQNNVPALPEGDELKPYIAILDKKYSNLIILIKNHLSQFLSQTDGVHGYEHLEWVACMAGYLAQNEAVHRKLSDSAKALVINKTVLAGLLHDIERHRGVGDEHMIEGEKTARKLLEKVDLVDEDVLFAIRNHDYLEADCGGSLIREIVYGSVFDADHFRYGLEREDTFWRMKEKKGIPPGEVIHDYQFVSKYQNAWKTHFGKEVGPIYIDFALAVSRHIEQKFSNSLE